MGSKMVSFGDAVVQSINELSEKGVVTFSPNDLYDSVAKIMEMTSRPKLEVSHRIRSSLNDLKKLGEIKHVGYSKWEICTHNKSK